MPHVTLNSFKRTGQQTDLLGFTTRSLVILIAFGLLLVAAIGVAVYFYFQYQQTQTQLNKSTQGNVQAALISEVGKLIVLPTGETPAIATVSDVNKLKGQSFFVHARNGDKVLIYSKAQEAILYDPLAGKIIEVGPISLTNITPTSTVSVTPEPVDVAIYNGTTTIGYSATTAQKIEKEMPNVTVVAKADAQKSTYTTSIIVDQTGKNATSAAALAKLLKGKVGPLPAGEAKSSKADILIILGK
ncbi:MAG TPA: LytR C-terminal domain-containing protein [Candidatus Saccharimonadales bacterium]|nr:LytR C-terminal domain-containing protein [Candidatus Saccharimonadales bacterium]